MATNFPTTGPAIAPARKRFHETLVFDLCERVFLLLLFIWFASRVLPSVSGQPYNMLILVSETFTAFLVLVRRPGPMATTAYAWTVAVVGTCAPLLVLPHGGTLIPVEAAAMLMMFGLFLSLAAKAFLRRSFGIVAACRGVRRGGVYRLVRHPMYSGYVITQAGFLLLNPSFWNAIVYAVAWLAMLLRIDEEEKFLSQDQAYRDYKVDVRWRLLPGLY